MPRKYRISTMTGRKVGRPSKHPKKRKRPVGRPKKYKTGTEKCIKCDVKLTLNKNWYPHSKTHRIYICKKCLEIEAEKYRIKKRLEKEKAAWDKYYQG